ncbi:MAG TPA: cytochrome c oxidase subunit II [Nevskiaceae bacterium]|nr:cytochrome c oxidase subunit II [Nevskiaceae bacterium]
MLKLARHLGVLASLVLSPTAALAYTGSRYNLPEGVTEISREVHDLHMMMFWVCCAIAVVVFGAMFYSVFAHRRSKNPKPADFHHSTTVEIVWTAIPFVILVGMAIPAAGTLIKMDDTRGSELTVKVTGYQWKWQYEYLDQGVSFFSTLSAESNRARQVGSGIDVTQVPNYLVDVDNPLVLPVGKKVRFLITSNDVIHAWWVPAMAVKKDAIPGYVNEVWAKIEEPGTYRGVCAELCGRDHGFMPIVVKAVPEEEFQAFLAAKGGKASEVAAASPVAEVEMAAAAAPAAVEVAAAAPVALSEADLLKTGEKVYLANCSACHQPTGQGLPPNFPSLVGSKLANGEAATQIAQLLKGKGIMPGFAHLSDADLAAVATYTRQSWGNGGSTVQATDIAAAR